MVVDKTTGAVSLNSAVNAALLLVGLLLVVVGCSDVDSYTDTYTAVPAQNNNEVTIDVVDFINKSGVEPRFPQLWIFDKAGTLISTERSHVPGKPLNIEANKIGPVAERAGGLEKYLTAQGVRFDRWQHCGADYCVVRLVVDKSLGHCAPCDIKQKQLDAYFLEQGVKVIYHSVILVKKAPELNR